jgi:hypothetical protein
LAAGFVVVFATGFVAVFGGGLEADFGAVFAVVVLLLLAAFVAVVITFLVAVSHTIFSDLLTAGLLTAAFWAVLDLFSAVALPLFLGAFAVVDFDLLAASCFADVNFAVRSGLLGADSLTVAL